MTGAPTTLRLAGAGGQGVVTAGRLLAEAAIASGHNAAQSQLYGPQARGGASRSDIIIARGPIGFPVAEQVDVLVVLSEDARKAHGASVSGDALYVIDERADNGSLDVRRRAMPFVDTALSVSGELITTGVVAIGAIAAMTGVVDLGALEWAVAEHAPARNRDRSVAALKAGVELAGNHDR